VDSATRALTPSEIIDQGTLSRFQISTIALCGLVLLLDGFDTQCIGFLAPSISETLAIPLKNFGPVFSAGLIGLMIASMGMGPIADRLGRKWPVVLSALTFALFALLTARSTSLNELIIFRFLTGLGLGGAMPNVVALTSEYSPKRLQAVFVGMLFVGMPLGALVGGLVSYKMIPLWVGVPFSISAACCRLRLPSA
jgi:AAHS family 4-hydroxybenzoate transporter-like MFS transporter